MIDSYLRQKYDISLEERDAIIAEQGGKCANCGKSFDGTVRMEVDHEHYKVKAFRSNDGGPQYLGWKPEDGLKGWLAIASLKHVILPWVWAKTKAKALKLAKKEARRASVRGVLCGGRYAGCNRKLGRVDNIALLEAQLAYLRNPPARRVLKLTLYQ